MVSNNSDAPLFGFINVYKPKGITSHDVVSKLRKITKIKQIGHTGTLDPFAVGVLPICIGKATRLIEYLEDDKEYIATVQFGKNTDSYDIDGNVTEIFEKKITKEDLLTTLKNFEGEISQLPPIYSAIKVNGKKLYDYARKGETVEIQPRKVYISKIKLLNFDYETQTAEIDVGCSKGTYIRSIAYDIGKSLNCGGFLSALKRTKAGKFCIENSVKLEEITDKKFVNQNIINPLNVIDLPKHNLSEDEVKKVAHGMSITNNSFKDEDIVFLIYSGKIYAIGMVNKNKILVKKVFEVL
jgi:tRNA pseudouridine55 synthase